MKLSVIIPCYNEEKTVAEIIARAKAAPLPIGWDKEIIVIDDGSTDGTKNILRGFMGGWNSQDLRIFLNEKNRGKGAAIKEGFGKAAGDYILIQDADLEYDPNDYQKLLAPIIAGDAEIAFGARTKSGAGFRINPLFLCSLILTKLFNFFFGSKLGDMSTCYKVFPRRLVPMLLDYPAQNFSYDAVELTHGLIRSELPMKEVPIRYEPRETRDKKMKPRDGFEILGKMVWLRFFSPEGKMGTISMVSLFAILALYVGLSLQNIHTPFIHVSEDNNGIYGLSALNWVKFGPWTMKFGMYVDWLNNAKAAYGHFYTDHPSLFLIPTYFIYLIFGASDVATRLGPMIATMAGLVFLFFAVRKTAGNLLLPAVTSLVFVILPGTIYYGKTLELTVFVAPASLVTFSLFVLYYFEQEKIRKTIYFWAFWASVAIGCLTAWFYYFMPIALWLFIFLTKEGGLTPKRKSFLVFIPVLLISMFLSALGQFYLLNRAGALSGLRNQFLFRLDGATSGSWLGRISWISVLNFNTIFLAGAFIGLILFFVKIKRGNNIFYLPLLLAPFLVLLIFHEWSTHPFGMIDFLPAIAILNGLFLASLIEDLDLKITGYLLVAAILAVGLYFSLQKLDYFYNQFLILHPNDIQLLENIKPRVGNDTLCMGQNDTGIGFNGIAEWYLREQTLSSPSCFSENPTIGLVFLPSQVNDIALQEMQTFKNHGFHKLIDCGDSWCAISK
jgi:dolichol-phosphate mannosyltransferase